MNKLYKVIKEKDCCLDGIHLSTLKVGEELTLDACFANLLGDKIVQEIKFERVKESAPVKPEPVKEPIKEEVKEKRTRRSKEQMEADRQAAIESK